MTLAACWLCLSVLSDVIMQMSGSLCMLPKRGIYRKSVPGILPSPLVEKWCHTQAALESDQATRCVRSKRKIYSLQVF